MFLSLTATKLLTLVCVIVLAVIFFAYATVLKKNYRKNLKQYDGAVEGIVSRQWKTETPLDNGEVSTTWYVDYQYTVDEQEYELNSGIGHFKKMFQDGDKVTILYHTEDPEQFYVASENTHDKTVYTLIYVLGVIVIFTGILLMILANKLG